MLQQQKQTELNENEGLKWIVAFISSGHVLLYSGAWKLQSGPTASANSWVQEKYSVCL